MKKRYIYFIGIAIVVITVSVSYFVSDFFIVGNSALRENIIENLNDIDWQKRDRAVNDLLSHKELLKDKKMVNQVIDLLNKEVSENNKLEGNDATIEHHIKQYGEGYGEYFLDTLDLARNINDTRIIPGLIDSVGSGLAVEKKLASFGEQTIDPIVKKFQTAQEIWERVGCVNTLYLIDKQPISKDSKEKIKQILFSALKDDSIYVRDAAQNALKGH